MIIIKYIAIPCLICAFVGYLFKSFTVFIALFWVTMAMIDFFKLIPKRH
jgi:hypothetical protein